MAVNKFENRCALAGVVIISQVIPCKDLEHVDLIYSEAATIWLYIVSSYFNSIKFTLINEKYIDTYSVSHVYRHIWCLVEFFIHILLEISPSFQ